MFLGWLVIVFLTRGTHAKRRNIPQSYKLWDLPKGNVDSKRNCSIQRSSLVTQLLNDSFYPVFEKYGLEVPKKCPFYRERNIYKTVERSKSPASLSNVKCELCGKVFYTEKYVHHHMLRKHAELLYYGRDAVCLSDYCDIFRCDLHEMGVIAAGQSDTCTHKDIRPLQRRCENVINSCLPNSMRHSVYDALYQSICSRLTCKSFYADFEDITIWDLLKTFVVVTSAMAVLYLAICWFIESYIDIPPPVKKRRPERMVEEVGVRYKYSAYQHLRRR